MQNCLYLAVRITGFMKLKAGITNNSEAMKEFKELREQAYLANMQLPELNLVIFTFGNVSAADQSKKIVCH